MRSAVGALIIAHLWACPVFAAKPDPSFKASNDIFTWIDNYSSKPEPERVPAAVHAMRVNGLFKDLDQTGLFVGFIAGVMSENQADAHNLIERLFPMPPREQIIIIKSIAYSGIPYWKDLLGDVKERMPGRQVVIEQYLSGEKKTLMERSLDSGPDVIDALWGMHSATGYHEPVVRVMSALQWSDETDDLDKLTVAHKAQWTLAAAAERDRDLLNLYRLHINHQPKAIATPLKEVADAAEAYNASVLRKDSIEAIREAKRKGPAKSTWSWASQAGQTVLSVGCVIASALGHPEIAAPCIITGAMTTGVTKLLELNQE